MIESSEQIGTISWKTEAPKSLQLLTINDRNDYYYTLTAFKVGVKQRNWIRMFPTCSLQDVCPISRIISSLYQVSCKTCASKFFFSA